MSLFEIGLMYVLGVGFTVFGMAPYLAKAKYPKIEIIITCIAWIVIIGILCK